MKRPSASRIAAYAIAAIVGFGLGSYRFLAPAGDGIAEAPASTVGSVSAPASQSSAIPVAPGERGGAKPSSVRNRHTEPTPRNEDGSSSGLVFASEGLVLRPAVADDRFIGFLVVRNDSDRRFSVGDVIVSVNDQPVENSAAGSELLIASLANPNARVEIRAAED